MILERKDGWLISNVANEILMLNVESNEYIGINSSGALIWEFLESPKSDEQILDYVISQYAVSPDQAKEGLAAFLEIALERGIVAPRKCSSPSECS